MEELADEFALALILVDEVLGLAGPEHARSLASAGFVCPGFLQVGGFHAFPGEVGLWSRSGLGLQLRSPGRDTIRKMTDNTGQCVNVTLELPT